MLLVMSINAYPLIHTIIKSFTYWDGITKSVFVGLVNYFRIVANPTFDRLLVNSSIVLLYMPISIVVSTILAVVIASRKKTRLIMYVVYIPQIVSVIILGKSFRLLFNYNGYFNQILEKIGFTRIDFLGNHRYSLAIILLAMVWFEFGWQTIMFISAIKRIDSSFSELMLIDNLGVIKKIFSIYLPNIRNTIIFVAFIGLMFSFTGVFPLVYFLTGGGPGYDTTTLDYMIYIKAFGTGNNMGEACALSVLFLLFMFFVIIIFYAFIKLGGYIDRLWVQHETQNIRNS